MMSVQVDVRVVHVIESFSGGSLKVVQALVAGIRELDGRPVHHTVIHGLRPDSGTNPREGFADDVDLIPWPGAAREINPLADWRAYGSLKKILSRRRFDGLHLHSSKAGFLGRLVALRLGIAARVLYTPHGVAIIRQDVSATKRRLYALLERLAFRCGGEVVACSAFEAGELKQIGVHSTVIPNGIRALASSATHDGQSMRVVGVGRITAAKDPAAFAAIARQAHARGLPCRFVWVGDGDLAPAFAGAPVQVTGWLTQQQVVDELAASDIFLSTSLWEGLPLAALQAMSCGVPLLLSRNGGNRDLLADTGGFAIGFSTVDDAEMALADLLLDGDRRQRMSEAGRTAFLRSYTEAAMCEAYGRLYARRAASSDS
jgi:glycosyltransferase involved in cell wall biosynthesis